MKTLSYRVTLLADTVISQGSATAGDHQCLDYLPGATFLGACAGQLYRELGVDAWTVFHSGKVRFRNALPLTTRGQLGVPLPLVFHKPKTSMIEDGSDWVNLARAGWDVSESGQPKQQREGFLICPEEDKPTIKPRRSLRLKTAIDRDKGNRAKEGQLFGYQYLAAGSQWYLQVDLDADLPGQLAETLDRCLTEARLRIGRSRSAEFGGVRIEPVAAPVLQEAGQADRLLIYCLSDLALRDQAKGMPTLRPTAGMFKLQDATFSSEHSFLRFRSYAPFNSHRGANDLERQVIVAGSVIAFDLNQPLTEGQLQELQQHLAGGLGDYRQDGLGQVWVNPPFLQSGALVNETIATVELPQEQKTDVGETALTNWLASMVSEQDLVREARETARGWLEAIGSLKNGPSCSQWRELGARAGSAADKDDLKARLFVGEKALCTHGVSSNKWSEEHRFGETYTKFLAKLVDPKKPAKPMDDELLCRSLAHLGRVAAAKLRRGEKTS